MCIPIHISVKNLDSIPFFEQRHRPTNRLYCDAGGRSGGGGGGGSRNGSGRVSRDRDGSRVMAGRAASWSTPVLAGSSGAPCQHVDDGVLDQRREDEHQTDDHPNVDGLDVRDPRQRRPSTATHCRRRQHGQQAYGDARRTGVDVDPE